MAKLFFYIFTFSFLSFGLSFANAEEIESLTKQEKWDQLSLDIDSWIDGIGYPIDPKIKNMVVALNLLGIPTSASCEGHLDHGGSFPWVDIEYESDELQNILKLLVTLTEKRDHEEKVLLELYPHLTWQERSQQPEAQLLLSLYSETHALWKRYDQAKKTPLLALQLLLIQFYQTQPFTYDKVLFLDVSARLQSLGGEWQILRTDEEKANKLQEYQQEMDAFASFLKNQFFQQE